MIIEDSKGNKFDVGEGSITFHFTDGSKRKTNTLNTQEALNENMNLLIKLHPNSSSTAIKSKIVCKHTFDNPITDNTPADKIDSLIHSAKQELYLVTPSGKKFEMTEQKNYH